MWADASNPWVTYIGFAFGIGLWMAVGLTRKMTWRRTRYGDYIRGRARDLTLAELGLWSAILLLVLYMAVRIL